MSEAEAYLSPEFRNYADVLIGTGHGDTETQRRSTRAACTAGRAVRRADRKRTTERRSSGRSFAVGTPRPPLRGAASSARPAACSSLCLCVSVAKYVVVFLKWDTDRRHQIRRRNCEIKYSVPWSPLLEIVPDPDCEARLAPLGRGIHALAVWRHAGAPEHHVFPAPVEQRSPRPVEVNRKAQRKRFEPQPVRRPAVLQPEAGDRLLCVVEDVVLHARDRVVNEDRGAGSVELHAGRHLAIRGRAVQEPERI